LDVELLRVLVAGNGGAGVALDRIGEASKLAVRGCTVYANGATRVYGPGSPQRPAGGVFLKQGALSSFQFVANRLSANAGDQLAFETNASAWSISPGACGAESNLFACIETGRYAVGRAPGGSVDASFSVWPDPLAWSTWVSAGVSSAAYCNGAEGAPAPPATCPSP
jgi:hypothetical protein